MDIRENKKTNPVFRRYAFNLGLNFRVFDTQIGGYLSGPSTPSLLRPPVSTLVLAPYDHFLKEGSSRAESSRGGGDWSEVDQECSLVR